MQPSFSIEDLISSLSQCSSKENQKEIQAEIQRKLSENHAGNTYLQSKFKASRKTLGTENFLYFITGITHWNQSLASIVGLWMIYPVVPRSSDMTTCGPKIISTNLDCLPLLTLGLN